jgi:hypothetical protein
LGTLAGANRCSGRFSTRTAGRLDLNRVDLD